MGRINKYEMNIKPYFKQIKDALGRGVSEKEIMEALNVKRSAWYQYKADYPEFADLFFGDKTELIGKLEDALVKKALGYNYQEVKHTTKTKHNGAMPPIIEETDEITEKHVSPSEQAIGMCLNRFDPNYKKDYALWELKRQELELKIGIAKANNFDLSYKDLFSKTDDQLAEMIENARNKNEGK